MAATPNDRKPSAAEKAAQEKKQREAISELMSSGVDFTPFTIDVGDGTIWSFKPDMMPADIEQLRSAMVAVGKTSETGGEGLQEAFDGLIEAVRSCLMDEKEKKAFPKPMYGTNALTFFAMSLIAGRTGFPTE